MKIAAYEVRRDEQKDFAFIAEKLGVELTETEDNLTLENIEGVTTLGRTRFDRALLTAVRERGVKYISTRTIGADHIDLTAAKELGLKVCNSNYAPNGVADYTVMLILLSLRKYKPALWRAQVNDYSLAGLQGRELRNLTVGILGARTRHRQNRRGGHQKFKRLRLPHFGKRHPRKPVAQGTLHLCG